MTKRANPVNVGYLPIPRRHARYLLIVLPVLTILAAMLGASLAALQRSPGDATWQTGLPEAWTGTFLDHPYPPSSSPMMGTPICSWNSANAPHKNAPRDCTDGTCNSMAGGSTETTDA